MNNNNKKILVSIIAATLLSAPAFAKQKLDDATQAGVAAKSSSAMQTYDDWNEDVSAESEWELLYKADWPNVSYKKHYYPEGTKWVRALFKSGDGEYIERIFPPYEHSPAKGKQIVYSVIDDCSKPHKDAPAIKSSPKTAYCKANSTNLYLQGSQCRGVVLGGKRTQWMKDKNGVCNALLSGLYGNPKIGIVKIEVMK